MNASVRALPSGIAYYDGHGGGIEIALVNDGVSVDACDGYEQVKITVPDDVWVAFCQRFVQGQDGQQLAFKDRTLLKAGRQI